MQSRAFCGYCSARAFRYVTSTAFCVSSCWSKSDADAGAGSGKTAQQFYDALAVTNQAQIREFYLTALEAVDLPLREKYKKLYRYY